MIIIINKSIDKPMQSGIIHKENDSYSQLERSNSNGTGYDLGFVKGERVQVIGENPSGMILLVKGVRIALNRGLASRIMVV